ncbi:fimbrial biogenesis outer membrane usher protein, partial [Pseudomonas edaphica]
RNIAPWNSKLIIGETNTSGELFDSVGFRGVQLATDDRMLPESLRGYAPVVRGVASTNALVEIRQNNILIYQAPVAAGAFEFNDLYSTGYGGELAVTIIEADGRVHGFNVPYASVAQSLRPGTFRYSVTAGQINERFLHDKPQLLQATVQRGFTNLVTGYGGVLASDGYGAGLVGAALNTEYGALSMDLSHARTEVSDETTQSGQSLKLGYSKLFSETGTNFAVAAYRYSTSGYLSFRDALTQREFNSKGRLEFNELIPARDSLDGPLDLRLTQQARDFAQSQALRRQRDSFQLTVSQPLGEFGSVYATGSKRNYWNSGSDTQYQIGYNNHWGSLGYSLSAMRTRDVIGRTGTEYYVSLSLPLGTGSHAPSLRSMVTRSDRGTNTQVGLTGTAGVDSNFDYGVTAARDTRDDIGNSGSTNVQYRSPVATLRGSYGQGSNYTQASAGISGAMVAHSGGVTLAPQVGETMAIVEADAAKGARIVNSSGVRIDGNGYAALPYLSPYSSNTVELDPTGVSNHVELQSTSQQVAPFAGAVVKVKFATVRGRAVFIHALGPQEQALPFAAEVFDAQGQSVGIVSQASRLYVRGIPDQGVLTVKWGETAEQRCFVNYQLPPLNEKDEVGKRLETVKAKCVSTPPISGVL